MKYLPILLALFTVTLSPVMAADDGDEPAKASAADIRSEKKAAQEWYKNAIKSKTAAVKTLKKVKDEKSAEKAGKELQKLFGVSGKSTAMGETGVAQKPTGEAAEELEKKMGPKLEKLDEDINKQIERIQELEVNSSELDKGLESLNAAS